MSTDNIDISNYTYSVRFLISGGIIAANTEEILQYIEERKAHDIEVITKELEEYSSKLINVFELSKFRDKFYSYRQRLIQRKQLILDDQAYMVRDNSINKKNEVVNYKIGNNDDNLRPANDFERKALLESKLSGFQIVIDSLENHITFLMESIKNISDMIYGFQYVIALEEYRKNS